ncbi:hypothetical protein NDU88_001623 [Pleurodeles waltl]|uniref:Uncharacterized protein n=1 Tax=Pleurodeles waltl TaxID=8319 RepID=A0AAV7VC08_PLEWA|nr:hypothetical protein NDU88_001623 [Pleurodeles waltl]
MIYKPRGRIPALTARQKARESIGKILAMKGKTPVGSRALCEARNRNGTARRGRAVPLPKLSSHSTGYCGRQAALR